jgi:hypothetical protein
MRARAATSSPLRFAYADPPYPKMSHLYRGHPDYAGEVDHAALVARLAGEYPDGWALSTSAAALPVVLPLAAGIVDVAEVRVAAWVRGERPARHWSPLSAWEPVIVYRGRRYLSGPEPGARRADALVYAARARTTDRRRVMGAKPAAFCWWMFDLLGALPGDELVDLYPGSGGVGRAWGRFVSSVDREDASLRARGVASGGRTTRRVGTWSTCR